MAATSPLLTSAGPEVIRKPAPISQAMMPARVVLPSPGGPANSTWSTGWPRRRAASRMIWSFSRNCCWPTKSARRFGRIPTSKAASASISPRSERDPVASVRTVGPSGASISRRGLIEVSSPRRKAPQRLAQQLLDAAFRGQGPQRRSDLVGGVSQLGEGLTDLRCHRGEPVGLGGANPAHTVRAEASRSAPATRPRGGPQSSGRCRERASTRRRSRSR